MFKYPHDQWLTDYNNNIQLFNATFKNSFNMS